MQSLEAAILLRLPPRDDLDADAGLEQPDPELGKTRGASRGEWWASVGADRRWQSEFEEGGVEYWAHVLAVGVEEGLTAQQVPAEGIDERERIASPSVAG